MDVMTPTTMKLFFAPSVCSLAPHIVLREIGASFDLVRVDLRTKKTSDGSDYEAINPKSYVPALVMEDGGLLTEAAVILRYLADTRPEARLAPPHGTMERLRFEELLHFIAMELHKGFAPFTLMPNVGDESKRWAANRLTSRVRILETALGSKPHLQGDAFTVVDAYAFWALRSFSKLVKVDLEGSLADYVGRVGERPSARAALEAEATAL